MKVLLETTGNFSLVDATTREYITIRSDRPTVSERTAFIHQRGILGQLRFLGDVNDEATTAEFDEYVKESDGNIQLAIESFLASYPPVKEEKEEADKNEKDAANKEPNPLDPNPPVTPPPANTAAGSSVQNDSFKATGKNKS